MATISSGYTFVNNETVTPAKLNSLAGSATISGIVNAEIDASAAIAGSKLADSGITTSKIADANVTTVKIADANVTTAKIADGAITGAKLNSSVILVPTGAVMPFAMNSAPTGWLAADGTAVSRATYSALWTALGTTSSPYGQGDGSTTFNLPDLRASFVRGAGSDGVATSGTFGVKQTDDFKSHTHIDSGHTHTVTGANSGYNTSGSGSWGTGYAANQTTSSASANIQSTGGIETRPRNIAMLYCIKT
jgi:microcystin-dependent protein